MAASVKDQVQFVSMPCPTLQPCHVIFSSPGVFITSPHPQAFQINRPTNQKVIQGGHHLDYQDQLLDLAEPPSVMSKGSTLPLSSPCTWTQTPSLGSTQSNWCQSTISSAVPNSWSPGYGYDQDRPTVINQGYNTVNSNWTNSTSFNSPLNYWSPAPSNPSLQSHSEENFPSCSVSNTPVNTEVRSSEELEQAKRNEDESRHLIESPVTPGIEGWKCKEKSGIISPKVMLRFKDIHGGLGQAAVSTYIDEPESPSGHTLLNISHTLLPKSKQVKKNSPAIRTFNFLTPKKLKMKKDEILKEGNLDLPPLMSAQTVEEAELVGFSQNRGNSESDGPALEESQSTEYLRWSPVQVSDVIGYAYESLNNEMSGIEDIFDCKTDSCGEDNASMKCNGEESQNVAVQNSDGLRERSTQGDSSLAESDGFTRNQSFFAISENDRVPLNDVELASEGENNGKATIDEMKRDELSEMDIDFSSVIKNTSFENLSSETNPQGCVQSAVPSFIENSNSTAGEMRASADNTVNYDREPPVTCEHEDVSNYVGRMCSVVTDNGISDPENHLPRPFESIAIKEDTDKSQFQGNLGKHDSLIQRDHSVTDDCSTLMLTNSALKGNEYNVSEAVSGKSGEGNHDIDTGESQSEKGQKSGSQLEVEEKGECEKPQTLEEGQIPDYVRKLLDPQTLNDLKGLDQVDLDSCIEAHEYIEALMTGTGGQEAASSTPTVSADSESESLLNFLSSDNPATSTLSSPSGKRKRTLGSPDVNEAFPKHSRRGLDFGGSDKLANATLAVPGNDLSCSKVEMEKAVHLSPSKSNSPRKDQGFIVDDGPLSSSLILPEIGLDESIPFWSQKLMDSLSSSNLSFSPLLPFDSSPTDDVHNLSLKGLENVKQNIISDSEACSNELFHPTPHQVKSPGGMKRQTQGKLPSIETLFSSRSNSGPTQSSSQDVVSPILGQGKQKVVRVQEPKEKENNCPIVMGYTGRMGSNRKRIMMFVQPEEMAGMKGEPMVYSVPNLPMKNSLSREVVVSDPNTGVNATNGTAAKKDQNDKSKRFEDSHVVDDKEPESRRSQIPYQPDQHFEDFFTDGAASCQEESVPPIHQEDQVLPNQARTKSTNPCPVLSGSILSVPSLPCTSKSQTEAPAPQKKVVGAVEESVPEEVPAGGGFSSGAITTMASPSDVVGSRSRVRKKMTLTSSEFVRMVNMYDKCAERQQLSGLLVHGDEYFGPVKQKPLHYPLRSFVVGTFKHNHPMNLSEKSALFKVYFGKRRLVYDFLALDKSGKPRRSGKGGWQQCVIEVMFEDIVELYGYRDYLRIQVSKNPKVHLSDIPQPGERPGTTSDKPGKKRAVDITEGQLIKAWTHEIMLSTPSAHDICKVLANFDDHLKSVIKSPRKGAMRRHSNSDGHSKLTPSQALFPCPATPETPSQPSNSLESSYSQFLDHLLIDNEPAEEKKSKGHKPKRSKFCCRCVMGCKVQRCRCRRGRRVCDKDCGCKMTMQCSQMLENMKLFRLSNKAVELNTCLFDNIEKKKVLERALSDGKVVRLPCCKRDVLFVNLAKDIICSSCKVTFKYSWCTGTFHNSGVTPRNHCFKCRTCLGKDHNHCEDPKVGCPCCEYCSKFIPGRSLFTIQAASQPEALDTVSSEIREGIEEPITEILDVDTYQNGECVRQSTILAQSIPDPASSKAPKKKVKMRPYNGVLKLGPPVQIPKKSRKKDVVDLYCKLSSKALKKKKTTKTVPASKVSPILNSLAIIEASERVTNVEADIPVQVFDKDYGMAVPEVRKTFEVTAVKKIRVPKIASKGKRQPTSQKKHSDRKANPRKLSSSKKGRKLFYEGLGGHDSLCDCKECSERMQTNGKSRGFRDNVELSAPYFHPSPLNTPEYNNGSSSDNPTASFDAPSSVLGPLFSEIEHYSPAQFDSFLPSGFMTSPGWEALQSNFDFNLDVPQPLDDPVDSSPDVRERPQLKMAVTATATSFGDCLKGRLSPTTSQVFDSDDYFATTILK